MSSLKAIARSYMAAKNLEDPVEEAVLDDLLDSPGEGLLDAGSVPGLGDDWSQSGEGHPDDGQEGHVSATWLDALAARDANDGTVAHQHSDPYRIASVNSDDNGLYRMFIGVSP